MNKLSLRLENCYGINKLEYEFDFSNGKTAAVYAPNGVMKTSLAKTFRDLSEGKNPKDLVYDERVSVFEIIDDSTTQQILPEEIFVIEPYSEQGFKSDDKILTLLASQELREKFQAIYSDLEAQRKAFITTLKKVSGSTDCESEVFSTFSHISTDNLFEILKATFPNIQTQTAVYKFKYNKIFNPKVKAFLEENSTLLSQYAEKYEELISGSSFFHKTGDKNFGTSQANVIIEAIKDDSYFDAGHRLEIEGGGEIKTSTELVELVEAEISKIVNTPELRDVFSKIDSALAKNKELEAFKNIIENDNTIVSKLSDYEGFRKEVWYGYLNQVKENVATLIELYDAKKAELEKISEEARASETIWDKAVTEFNERFINLPFKLAINNKQDAILNQKTPTIDFQFENRPIERTNLLEVLSRGEKRAFYLLNIIFEVKSRQLQNQKTLFIIDDIADSFDYKNKYAIIEYLKDISQEDYFYQIILTHNFDFYRTISSRLGIQRKNKLHSIKTPDCIKVIEEVYQNLPFKTWKDTLKACVYYDKTYTTDDAKKHIIALIPFVRNLIEYGHDRGVNTLGIEEDFNLLTQLLHLKAETKNISFRNLLEIYKEYLGRDDFDPVINLDDKVYDTLIILAASVQDEEFNLENKIILAMIIRLKAEEYMWSKVTDKSAIEGNSTGKLFGRYKREFGGDAAEVEKIKILESVNIMTPENIHINSFMYEPILDMGIGELKNLYGKISA